MELSGTARALDESVRDPIYGRPCALYNVTARQIVQDGRGAAHWVTVFHDETSLPFFVEDETGRTMVYPRGARLLLKGKFDFSLGGADYLQGPQPEVERFVESLGLGGLNVEVEGWILEDGEPVCVFGCAGTDEDGDAEGPTWDESVEALKADAARWQAVGWEAALCRLRVERAAAGLPNPPPGSVVVRQDDAWPFVVSNEPQGRIASSLKWGALAKVALGPVIALGCGLSLLPFFLGR